MFDRGLVRRMRTVYLAGPIFGEADDDCIRWRQEATFRLPGWRVLNPMDRDYRGQEAKGWHMLVTLDLADIAESDVLLVNVERPSWGTAMEIREAFLRGKRVIGFGAPDPVSPWLRFHAELFPTLTEAIAAL